MLCFLKLFYRKKNDCLYKISGMLLSKYWRSINTLNVCFSLKLKMKTANDWFVYVVMIAPEGVFYLS